MDAQNKTLQGATTTAGPALMVIDAERPTDEDIANGVRDPLGFYMQYGFAQFLENERRVFKPTRVDRTRVQSCGPHLTQQFQSSNYKIVSAVNGGRIQLSVHRYRIQCHDGDVI